MRSRKILRGEYKPAGTLDPRICTKGGTGSGRVGGGPTGGPIIAGPEAACVRVGLFASSLLGLTAST